MSDPLRVAHYLNQFFAGIGGEERADVGVTMRPEPVGPGRALRPRSASRARRRHCHLRRHHIAEREEPAVAAIRAKLVTLRPTWWWRDRPSARAATASHARWPVAPRPRTDSPRSRACIPTTRRSRRTGACPHRPHRGVGDVACRPRSRARALRAAPGAWRSAGARRGRRLHLPRAAPRLRPRPAGLPARARHAARQAHGRPFVRRCRSTRPSACTPAAPIADLCARAIAMVTTGGLVRRATRTGRCPPTPCAITGTR